MKTYPKKQKKKIRTQKQKKEGVPMNNSIQYFLKNGIPGLEKI